MGRHPVVKHEDTAHFTLGNDINGLTDRQMQMVDGGKDNQNECRKETECLEGVCKHQRADASTTGVKPNQ